MSLGRARRIGPRIAPILLPGPPSSCTAGRKPPHCRFPPCARTGRTPRSGPAPSAPRAPATWPPRNLPSRRARKRGYSVSNEKAADLREAEAWLAFAKGKSDEALQELRAAADHQDKNGGESVSIPAREMLADMLFELKRPPDSLVEYKIVLKNSPNRFDALYGAMRAAASIHSPDARKEAQAYSNQLMACCGFRGDRPELRELASYAASREQGLKPAVLDD